MIAPVRLAHVVYRTYRFDEMLEWYQLVLGARTPYRNPALAFLTYDGEHHRLAIANLSALMPQATPQVQQPGLVGVDHVAYSLPGLGDLVDLYTRLLGHGIRPFWPVHHGQTISLYYRDPDGNRVEFQVDRFATPSEANAFMTDSALDRNPIGVEFDPDALTARYRAGVPTEMLLRQPEGPPAAVPAL